MDKVALGRAVPARLPWVLVSASYLVPGGTVFNILYINTLRSVKHQTWEIREKQGTWGEVRAIDLAQADLTSSWPLWVLASPPWLSPLLWLFFSLLHWSLLQPLFWLLALLKFDEFLWPPSPSEFLFSSSRPSCPAGCSAWPTLERYACNACLPPICEPICVWLLWFPVSLSLSCFNRSQQTLACVVILLLEPFP